MSDHPPDPLDHPEVRLASAGRSIIGFVLSLLLMAAALGLTLGHVDTPLHRLIAIACLAALALVAQAVFVFRLDVGEAQLWKTIALVLVLPLFVLSIGLTDLMFHTLYARTMIQSVMHGSGM